MTAAEPTTAMATIYSEHVSELVVAAREPVADGVVSLVLEHPAGEELPAWTPGAHVDLLLAPDVTRQYSLCGSPADRTHWRMGVLLDQGGRGGSRHVHERLEVGSRLPVRGPRNHFPLVAAERYLFIAGGIGITPLLPMMAQAEQAGADWTLFYGGRRRGSMAFLDELATYGDRVVLRPEDEYGLLDLPTILTPQPGTAVYSCGPEALLQAVEQQCAAWPPGSLHVERFAAKPVAEGATATSF
jgi:ferredoxin-NADP reductase